MPTFEAYKTLVSSIASDGQGGLLLPSDRDEQGNYEYDLSFIRIDGRNPADMSNTIERHDRRIAGTTLADFILLGSSATGSFGLSKDKTELWTICLEGWLKMISQTANRRLVRTTWGLNGWPDETRPKVLPEEYLERLARAGMPLFPDAALEDALRSDANLPAAPEDDEDMPPMPGDGGVDDDLDELEEEAA